MHLLGNFGNASMIYVESKYKGIDALRPYVIILLVGANQIAVIPSGWLRNVLAAALGRDSAKYTY
jgi:hypothetical protein